MQFEHACLKPRGVLAQAAWMAFDALPRPFVEQAAAMAERLAKLVEQFADVGIGI